MSQPLTLVIIYQLPGFKHHRILEAEDWNCKSNVFVVCPRGEQLYLLISLGNNKSGCPRGATFKVLLLSFLPDNRAELTERLCRQLNTRQKYNSEKNPKKRIWIFFFNSGLTASIN